MERKPKKKKKKDIWNKKIRSQFRNDVDHKFIADNMQDQIQVNFPIKKNP